MSRSIHVNDRGKGPTIKNLDVPFFKTDNTYCLRLGRPGLYKCVRYVEEFVIILSIQSDNDFCNWIGQ